MLERWGIASRNGARADELPGGFATVGDVMRAMEDAGIKDPIELKMHGVALRRAVEQADAR